MIARITAITAVTAFGVARAGVAPLPCNAPGVTTPAAANLHIASDYPVLSIVLREEGTTILAFVIGTDGRPGIPTVVQSSGSLRLDDASKEALRAWVYKPALMGGAPTACLQRAQVKWLIPEAPEPPKKAQ
jgi:TonB family protein